MAKPAAGATLTRDQQQRRWQAFRSIEGNSQCCECAAPDTTWAVIDYGILICINCAGAHRSLGSHISKVRGTELDDFDESLFLWFESLGNKKNNARWEAELPPTMRRPQASGGPACIRRLWLRAKYDEMRYLAGTEARGASHESTRGWLQKQSSSLLNTWKRRFFVVGDGQLLYYADEEASGDAAKVRGAYHLASATVRVDADDGLKFTVSLRSGALPALRAESQQELEAWARPPAENPSRWSRSSPARPPRQAVPGSRPLPRSPERPALGGRGAAARPGRRRPISAFDAQVWCLYHSIHAASVGRTSSASALPTVRNRRTLTLFASKATVTKVEQDDPRFVRSSMPG